MKNSDRWAGGGGGEEATQDNKKTRSLGPKKTCTFCPLMHFDASFFKKISENGDIIHYTRYSFTKKFAIEIIPFSICPV